MKKNLFHAGIPALALVFVVALIGCASTPAFEAAGSLAGTYWMAAVGHDGKTPILIIKDEASGVFTFARSVPVQGLPVNKLTLSNDEEETPFAYTAVYQAEGRAFTGTLTPAGGAEGAFSLTKGTVYWGITAPGLGLDAAKYIPLSPKQIQGLEASKM